MMWRSRLCLLLLSLLLFIHSALSTEEELFHQGQSVLIEERNINDNNSVLEINMRALLTESGVNGIFQEVFTDLKSGLTNVGTILTTHEDDFNEAVYGCRAYSRMTRKALACDLLSLKRQLSILNTFNQLQKVTHVRSLLEFKDYSISKYLSQLKLSKEFRTTTQSIRYGTNAILTLTQEQAGRIATYFKSMADFDREIANQDRLFIMGRLATLNRKSNDLWGRTQTSLFNIIKAAIAICGIAVGEDAAALAMEIAQCFNPIKLVLGGCSPNDFMDRLGDLMESIRGLAKAVALEPALQGVIDSIAVLRANFEKNGEEIAMMNNTVLSFPGLSDEDKIKKAKEFIDAYNAYSPQVTAQHLARVSATLEYFMETGCDLIRETTTYSVGGLIVEQLIANDCNSINSKVEELGSFYSDWFSFQFELIDSFTKMVRGEVAVLYSDRLTTMNTQMNVREAVIGLTMDEIKLQTTATAACNIYEYKAGGTRPSECKTGLFTSSSIDTLISYTGSLSLSKDKVFAWIPTTGSASDNTPHLSIDRLLNEETVRFQLPIGNTAWMSQYNWIPNNSPTGTAYFIERMDLYVPGLKCTDGTSASVSVEVVNDGAVSIFNEPAPPQYLIEPKEMKFQSEENSEYCQPCAQVSFPVKANGNTGTVRAQNTVCVKSNGLIDMQESTLLPPMFSIWSVRLRQESCTLTKDATLGYTPMITASITRVHMRTTIDECWPNPCPTGQSCTDGSLSYTCA